MKRYTQHLIAAIIGALALLQAPPPADACGVKLIAKSPGPRKLKRVPVKTEEKRPVIAQTPVREPIAAGPQPDRRAVAAKPAEPKPEPKPPEPAPAPAPATPPTPPAVAVAEPKPEPPRPEPPPPAAPKKVAAISQSEVFFRSNSAEVGNQATLNRVVRWMKSDPNARVTLEGHADLTGTADGNMRLSRLRAEAVRDHLVAAGIDESRVTVEAYGDTRPHYGRTDGRNRRVVIAPNP